MGHPEKTESLPSKKDQIGETSEKSFDVRIQEVRKMLEDARKAPTVNWTQYVQAIQGKMLLWQQGIKEKKIINVKILTPAEVGGSFNNDAFVYVKKSMPEELLRLNDPTLNGASWVVSPETKAQFMSHLMDVPEAEKLYGIFGLERAFFVNKGVVNGIQDPKLKEYIESQIGGFLGFLEKNIGDLEKISTHIDEVNVYLKDGALTRYDVSIGNVLKQIGQ